MTKEFDYLPWNTLINSKIKFFLDILDGTEFFGDLKQFLIKIIDPIYNKLGWNEENEREDWIDK